MTYYIMADIHGYYDEMQAALSKAGFDIDNSNHVFVSLGDLFDRGTQAKECLSFVNSIPDNRKILIRGNHEDLLDDAIYRKHFLYHDRTNGTYDTVCQFIGKKDDFAMLVDMQNYEPYKEYKSKLYDYYEIGNHVFTHGWIPNQLDWKDCFREFKEARWLNGMKEWYKGVKLEGKTIYCGHWHTSWGHCNIEGKGSEFGEDADFSPFVHEGIVALDSCTALSKFCNCWVVDINDDDKG